MLGLKLNHVSKRDQWRRLNRISDDGKITFYLYMHAVYIPAKKVLWVFVPEKLLVGFKTPLKLSVVNLNCDDIFFSMFKTSTQTGGGGGGGGGGGTGAGADFFIVRAFII